MRISLTKPEVFIIESLGFDDEKFDRQEGRLLRHILQLNGKKPEYYYIRTKRELEEVLSMFRESRYRYLHLSCHGNDELLATTLDNIGFDELGALLRPFLKERRLFLSACELANDDLASAVLKDSDCYSVIGPSTNVSFGDAALLWASFYHLMFRHESSTMRNDLMLRHCGSVAKLFEVSINFYSRNRKSKSGFKLTKVGTEEA